ncbi:Hypothetical Protein FCC1311_044192 [Hondaea fermentalgiana]|uniref:Uncharacterized protein n=1 Tax=Hondaea fermentalgiana TaxID=2315210 RepID=A0A2R5GAZ8_9STRA|nr:Hypothetical Protein FCC1311_044192 [Hondaea fermentalgiana]|eukprot:GBG28196.1 Hypothetical Protein FCC1311_044192 [Hondaea fermentalgiana]
MLAGWARGAAESLVFIAAESCSDQMHRLVDVIASAPKIRAVVVEDWLSGNDASTPAALPSSIKKSSMPSPPVCTITHNAMKRMELIYGKMPPHRHFARVRLNNRQFENLYVFCDQCAVQGVYIDGVPLDINTDQPTLGVTVSEHYRTVAVTVRAKASGASFVLGLSDGAIHNNFDGDNNINGADDDNNADDASSSDSHEGPSYIWPAQGGAASVGEVTTCFASRSSARVSKYGSTMDGAEASVDLVRLFFDEQIEIQSGEVLVSNVETHKVVRVISLDSATLSRTRFPNDTITLRINKATELVEGAYDLNVPNFAIFDMAGNMFTGTSTFTSPLRFSAAASPGVDIVEPLPIKPDPVPLPIPDPMEPWVPDEPSPSPSAKSGGLGAFFVIVIVGGVLGGLFVVARKSWRRGPGSSSSAPFYDRLGDTFSDLTTSLSGRLARAESSFAPSAYSAHDHSAAHASLETELSSSAVASRAPSESTSVGLLDAEVGPS